MHSLARAARTGGLSGEKLRLPYPRLNKAVDLRTREISVVAAAPGGGKSTLAVNIAAKIDTSVLYIVQDTPASIMARFAAVMLNRPVNMTHRLLQIQDPTLLDELRDHPRSEELLITAGAHSISLIEEKIKAYEEWAGEAPKLIILDNLVDTKSDKGSAAENVFYADVLLRLKQLAIEKNCHFMVLHHVKRSGNDSERDMGRSPMRMKDLLFAGDRESRHVWGVYNNGKNVITLQILKQQDGAADPLGGHRIPYSWDPAYSTLTEIGVIHT